MKRSLINIVGIGSIVMVIGILGGFETGGEITAAKMILLSIFSILSLLYALSFYHREEHRVRTKKDWIGNLK